MITTHEKTPHVMGFRLMDDDEVPQPAVELEQAQHAAGDIAPMAPEDEVLWELTLEMTCNKMQVRPLRDSWFMRQTE